MSNDLKRDPLMYLSLPNREKLEDSLRMFKTSIGVIETQEIPTEELAQKPRNTDLEKVSEILTNLLGKSSMNEEELLNTKLGMVELLDSFESKFISEDNGLKSIFNQIMLLLLMKIGGK